MHDLESSIRGGADLKDRKKQKYINRAAETFARHNQRSLSGERSTFEDIDQPVV